MAVRMYSTLTGREDELVPMYPDGVLRMYVCGMTPKFHPHLGHARLFVAMDVIRRYLLHDEVRPELHGRRRQDHRARSS
jgi:cysteinyl-tRNA synthetase